MKTYSPFIPFLTSLLLLSSCTFTRKEEVYQPASPCYTAQYDRSVPPARIEVEKALSETPASLRLSQIASTIEYYTVGDATFPVTQVIAVPGGFLTFNHPRIFLCRPGEKRKRYGFKALYYRWDNSLRGQNLYYDKATTCLYVAMGGAHRHAKDLVAPYIGELPPMDSILPRVQYLFPEMLEKRYPRPADSDPMLTFTSEGYILCHTDKHKRVPQGITTFNLKGDTLCRFDLGIDPYPAYPKPDDIPGQFRNCYWNTSHDRLTFLLPCCDTIYQLRDKQTIAPLYAIERGSLRVSARDLAKNIDLEGKIWPVTLSENAAGVFLGLLQKGAPPMLNWLRHIDDFRPFFTHQVVYLKSDGKTYRIPYADKGFVNDLDDGLSFWPDGQTDDYLYMIRTATDLKNNVRLNGSPRQQKLKEYLEKLPENQYVLILVK